MSDLGAGLSKFGRSIVVRLHLHRMTRLSVGASRGWTIHKKFQTVLNWTLAGFDILSMSVEVIDMNHYGSGSLVISMGWVGPRELRSLLVSDAGFDLKVYLKLDFLNDLKSGCCCRLHLN